MTTNTTTIGISGLAAYVPPLRVQLRDWCRWTDNSWPKISTVVGRSFRVLGPDQSIYTMAATAVMRLIRQYDIDPDEIGFLGFGTESSTDNSAGPIIIKGMLDEALAKAGKARVSRRCEVPEFKHACLGGVYAMKGALRYLATDGRDKKAIVVCADIAEYARGSSGEPTQGAGAVAMLLDHDARLVSISLEESGSASAYRTMDFRKPMLRFCDQNTTDSSRIQDFPVFNGKYSTTCYIDETLHALNDMYRRRGIDPDRYLRSLNYIFMHRPYRRMPETGLAYAYLAALANSGDAQKAELRTYSESAGVSVDDVVNELNSDRDFSGLASEAGVRQEAFPLTAAVLIAFRKSQAYRDEVLAKLSLGGLATCNLGNLYTAAMPAWLAAGFEVALNHDIELAGEELLTMGYGSGDAAEIIPFHVSASWREAAARIRFDAAMQSAVDLTQAQYEALHDRRAVPNLDVRVIDEFVVDRIGAHDERHFADSGIEYYRYAHEEHALGA